MVKLFCLIVNNRNVFSVHAPASESVIQYTFPAIGFPLKRVRNLRFTRREHVYGLNKEQLVYDDTFAANVIPVPVEEDEKMVAGLPIHVYFPGDPAIGYVSVLVKLPSEPPVEDGVFEHYSDPFFSEFHVVGERNGWLEFDTPIPMTDKCQLYVRAAYKSIAEHVPSEEDPNRAMCSAVEVKWKSSVHDVEQMGCSFHIRQTEALLSQKAVQMLLKIRTVPFNLLIFAELRIPVESWNLFLCDHARLL